jgi:DNA-directed RNA polymerase sigma subunit (sigma70/sigma32)
MKLAKTLFEFKFELKKIISELSDVISDYDHSPSDMSYLLKQKQRFTSDLFKIEELIVSGSGNYTPEFISQKLGLSKDSVIKLEKNAIRKLKHPSISKKFLEKIL